MSNNVYNTRINNLCIYIILILVNISYCPGIILTPNYKMVMTAIIFLLIIGIFVSTKFFFPFIAKTYLSLLLVTVTYSILVYCFSGFFIFNVFYNLFIALTCIILGYSAINHSSLNLHKIFGIYILSALFLGLYSVFTNLGGFEITDFYAFSVKNSSSVLLATAQILCLFLIKDSKRTAKRMVWITAWIILGMCIITFRSRTCMIAVTIATIFFLIKSKTNLIKFVFTRTFILSTFIVVATMLLININLSEYIYDALFASKDTNDLNSVTSGRLDLFQFGWDFFRRHSTLGNISVGYEMPPIDNFILSQLANHGIVGSLFNFVAYITTWLFCIKGLIKSQIDDLYPFLTLFLLCLVSFTEGPFPFGPGTPVIATWFLIGWWYRNQKVSKIVKR